MPKAFKGLLRYVILAQITPISYHTKGLVKTEATSTVTITSSFDYSFVHEITQITTKIVMIITSPTITYEPTMISVEEYLT